MRTPRWTGVFVILLALGATAAAQDRPRRAVIGEPAPEIKVSDSGSSRDKDEGDALLERNRHRIIVLFFFRSTNYDSAEAIPILNKLHKDLHGSGVVIVGITDEKKDKYESFVKGKEVDFDVYGNGAAWNSYEVPAPPRIYLIDTNGILVDRFHPFEDLEERIRAQLIKTPPPEANEENLAKRLVKARKAFDDKEYGRAYTFTKVVRNFVEEESERGREVANLIKEIEQAAKKQIQEAHDAVTSKNYEEAAKLLAEISVRFEGSDIGADADKEIGRLMGDRELKAMVRKALDDARGRLLNDNAADQEALEQYVEALKMYREVVEKYPDTDAAKDAEQAIDRISDDPAAREKIRKVRAEEEANRWLDLGDRFAKVKMYRKAREYYEMVREKHADSRAASKIKDRLKDLPKEDPEEAEEDAAHSDTAEKTEKD